MDAASVIEEARDWSAAYHPDRIGDGQALRRLSRIQQDLYARAVPLNPDVLAVTEPETIAHATILAALEARTALVVPAFLTPIRAEYRLTELGYASPVAFATLKMAQNRGCPFPAVIPNVDTGLRLVDLRDFGSSRHGWEEEGQLEFYYVPRPTELALPADELTAPDWMRSKIVSSLAMWMGGFVGSISDALVAAAKEAEEGFQQTVIAHQGASSWYVHEGG